MGGYYKGSTLGALPPLSVWGTNMDAIADLYRKHISFREGYGSKALGIWYVHPVVFREFLKGLGPDMYNGGYDPTSTTPRLFNRPIVVHEDVSQLNWTLVPVPNEWQDCIQLAESLK